MLTGNCQLLTFYRGKDTVLPPTKYDTNTKTILYSLDKNDFTALFNFLEKDFGQPIRVNYPGEMYLPIWEMAASRASNANCLFMDIHHYNRVQRMDWLKNTIVDFKGLVVILPNNLTNLPTDLGVGQFLGVIGIKKYKKITGMMVWQI